MIKCAVCDKEFNSMITWKHLKTHNLTTNEYKLLHGELVSDEFRKLKRSQSAGKNNPNFGNKLSAENKKIISDANKNKRPHNFGKCMSSENKEVLSKKALDRNKIWRDSGTHPVVGQKRSNETRNKIKSSRQNQQITKEQISKAIETKRNNGHNFAFFKGKTHTTESKLKISKSSKLTAATKHKKSIEKSKHLLKEFGYTFISTDDQYMTIECNVCNSVFNRTRQYAFESKINKEMCNTCFPLVIGTSKAEEEIANFLRNYTTITQNDRFIISPKELDIIVPEFSLAIEYNGLYWHSEIYKSPSYHLDKTKTCLDKGIRLIHIFEDEWLNNSEIVKSRLLSLLGKSHKKIGARNCSVQEIDSKTANQFLNKNHLQGAGRSNICVGLYHKDLLVSVMTFLKGDISKNIKGWELNRFSSAINTQIIGGANKLFRYFIKHNNVDVITSFADLRWSQSDNAVYKILGFDLVSTTPPNYWYVMPNETKRHHRYGLRKPKNCTITERELRSNQGWLRIYDCGSSKWVWKSKD